MRWLVFISGSPSRRSDHALNLDTAEVTDWGHCVVHCAGQLEAAQGYVVVEADSEEEALSKGEQHLIINGQLRTVFQLRQRDTTRR